MTRLAAIGLLLATLILALGSESAAARVQAASANGGSPVTVLSEPVSDQARFQSGCMSLSQAVSRAKRQYGGRIVSAETRGKSHVIKVLTQDNKVKTVRYPAC
ncbi:MAG: hypothetical protein AAGA61_06415 [Pseudomonadota bacterium]